MILNFKNTEIFTNVAKTRCTVMDIREAFADVIYANGCGIKAHALALKIYNSDEETDFSEEEIKLIKEYSGLCTPAVIDAIHKKIEL